MRVALPSLRLAVLDRCPDVQSGSAQSEEKGHSARAVGKDNHSIRKKFKLYCAEIAYFMRNWAVRSRHNYSPCGLIMSMKRKLFSDGEYTKANDLNHFFSIRGVKSTSRNSRRLKIKGAVAWNGFFAHSTPSSLAIKDLTYFWSGSSNFIIMAKNSSLCVLGNYAKWR